jgi:hypothetical protein
VVDIRAQTIVAHNRQDHVCLFYDSARIKQRNIAVSVPTYYYAAEFFIRMFQNGSNKYSCAEALAADKFCCSAGIQAFPTSVSGKHPMTRAG